MGINSNLSKKLLFVIGSLELGGAEHHLVRVCQNLKIRGWNPEVFVMNLKGPLIYDLKIREIPIHYSKKFAFKNKKAFLSKLESMANTLKMFFFFCNLLLRNRYYALHFFLPSAYIFGGISSLLTFSNPRVMSRRSLNNYQAKNIFFKHLEYFLHSKMEIICANSKAVLDQLLNEGVKYQQLELIYNGVSLDQYVNPMTKHNIRKDLGVDGDTLLMIVVANLIPYKGHIDLLHALSAVKDKLPKSWKCLFVGRDDGIGTELINLALELELDSNILLLGSRRDVLELQFAADIGILPSHEEGFSNAVIEGLAASLPMIVSDAGGNAEAVQNEISGIVYKAGDIAGLASAILRMSNLERRLIFGREGRKRVEEKFNQSKMIDAYEAMYLRLKNHDE